MHFVSWAQRKKIVQWQIEGLLGGARDERPPLRAVTLGGPGTGKTTLTAIQKAFARLWLGAESVRSGALSHAAARIAGGRTFHSMYRLPRRSLQDPTALLSCDALVQLKEGWRSAEVEFKDEISMVGCDVNYQRYHRSLTANGSFTRADGGVAPNIASSDTGDFMQLPPVEKFALFEEVPLASEAAGDDGGADPRHAYQRTAGRCPNLGRPKEEQCPHGVSERKLLGTKEVEGRGSCDVP